MTLTPGLSLILFVIYFIPSIVAFAKGKGDALLICLLNLVIGWTVIGWIACLIWASSDKI
ncbi:hypothetical protein A3G63_01820 [Candidatus Kaiserbacteria bacterium RIFCSPLOWO2_12_FULL_52_8]|uniref:Superinfection immunity protein n=1 Tax=Candidatus Kaiserbacteria bacterium RIFCSPHIGHO2_01_FULL_53_31 TaxID=1798481 RepID=A0A1F6CIF1_9BACT|nr:MAG: hypothetical protein A2678_02685 [Candidatus Kaiserbacteria bacterium RIFCSPHIGHO2_01_FULL_53_31]OGG94430.1 MAG: hypothetical protein A3G63_01820 [Candidatus Kaiserbacteria bacterium RIFCSPLOWO2_12_FULL_52_8]